MALSHFQVFKFLQQKMKFKITKIVKIFLLLFIVCITIPAVAQNSILKNIGSINIDDVSDGQIQTALNEAKSSGISNEQMYQMAAQKGMPADQVNKLRTRVAKLQGSSPASAPAETQGHTDNSTTRDLNITPQDPSIQQIESQDKKEEYAIKSRIFGSNLFNNANLTFEPNLRIATPKNYILGPDDEIRIDLTGDDEASYKLEVSPEGTIRIEFAGIVQVNGLTIEQATARIKARLSQTYPALKTGRTTLTVGIGNIRSIKVTLLGEITKPGTYTLPSLATVFNALYASGGPNRNGSYRGVEVIRNNKIVAKLDMYDFLLKGYQENNIKLQDQDVIRVPVYKVRAQIDGEVKRYGAVFEVLPKETLADLINYAGGFTDVAYRAKIKVVENTETEHRVFDLSSTDYATYIPKNGDKFTVAPILNRFENRVSISGAVFRPGIFALQPGFTLSKLIESASGVKEDAFLQRGYILRLLPDNTTQLLSFNVAGILNKTETDITLQREDQVTISSIFDLRAEYKVTINGAIRQGGTYDYAENMSLQDLIYIAGGFNEEASGKQIEIARRIKENDSNSFSNKTTEIFHVDVDKALNYSGDKFVLQPFDIITVRNNTNYDVQRLVKIEGEVLHPGFYAISSKDERLSDLVKRSGGTTPLAYLAGASLKRNNPESGSGVNKINNAKDNSTKIRNLEKLQADDKEAPVDLATEIVNNNTVGIDLTQILKDPERDNDLILEEGDVLRVPKQLQTIKIDGEVLYPATAVYKEGLNFKYYISQAGGFTQKALRKHGYVVYANGSVNNVKHFLFFSSYPEIKPGSNIFIPRKVEHEGTSAIEWVTISTAIASMGAIILGILRL
jgi:protein involved in polysaccharide export with SLBB domain